MAPKSSRGTILLTVTSQGQQNALQKADQLTLDNRALCMDKLLCIVGGFPKSSHIFDWYVHMSIACGHDHLKHLYPVGLL